MSEKAELAATVVRKAMELTRALHAASEQGIEFDIAVEEISIGGSRSSRQVMAYVLTFGD